MSEDESSSSKKSNGTKPSSRSFELLPKTTIPLIAGIAAGTASTTLLIPLDVVKLRLQVTESSKPNAKFRFFRILGGIIKYEGLGGLYAGWTPAVLGSAVSWGGYFFIYEYLKKGLTTFKIQSMDPEPKRGQHARTTVHPSQVLTSIDNFVLACTSGAVMVGLTNPIWLIKTRMQLQMRNADAAKSVRPYRNMVDAVQTIVREESFWALYKGSGAALLLTSHGGVQFVVYEYLRKHFHYQRLSREESDGLNVWRRLELSTGYLAMGGIAKLYVRGMMLAERSHTLLNAQCSVATTATYPLQVIKARIQQRSESIELTDDGRLRTVKRNYSGVVSTITRIFHKEGLAGFFKGCFANAVRVAPGAAVTFLVYEEVSDLLGR